MRRLLLLTIALWAIFFAVACTSCAHVSVEHTPPTQGYFATVNRGKPVWCVVDDVFTRDECVRDVLPAVQAINKAVGYQLLVFAGTHHYNRVEELPGPQLDAILIGVANLPSPTLGITQPLASRGNKLMLTLIALSRAAIESQQFNMTAITLHELLHAVGCMHADPEGLYPSIMRPVYDPRVLALTPGDIATLRAAYAE